MKLKHDEFAISKIDASVMKDYYFARLYGEVNGMSVILSREQIRSLEQKEMLEYLFKNYKAGLRVYFEILEENFLAKSNFVNYPDLHPNLSTYTKALNVMYFLFHILMLLPTVLILIVFLKKKQWGDFEIILSLMLPMYLIMLTSGFTFWQGDRIILPSLPLWIVLYSVILSKGWRLAKRKLV